MSVMHKAEPGWVPSMDLADRLAKTLRETSIGVTDMAVMLGVTRETVGRWINGHTKPKRAALLAWSSITGVDLSWLETGEAAAGATLRARRDSNPKPSDLYPRLTLVRSILTAESSTGPRRGGHLRAVS